MPASVIAHVMHGTTVATNAVLTGRGARVGLLTTVGFEQVLHLARGETPGPLAGWVAMVKPDPLAAVEDTRGVRERIGAGGVVVEPLDEEQARAAVSELLERGVESLAISLLHAYANPAHEHRLRELVSELAPDITVSISSDVLPEFREYERTNVVVMNAHVRPTLRDYLGPAPGRLMGGSNRWLVVDPPLGRRPHERRGGHREASSYAVLGPGGRRGRRGARGPRGWDIPTSSRSTWAAPRRMSPLRSRASLLSHVRRGSASSL